MRSNRDREYDYDPNDNNTASDYNGIIIIIDIVR